MPLLSKMIVFKNPASSIQHPVTERLSKLYGKINEYSTAIVSMLGKKGYIFGKNAT